MMFIYTDIKQKIPYLSLKSTFKSINKLHNTSFVFNNFPYPHNIIHTNIAKKIYGFTFTQGATITMIAPWNLPWPGRFKLALVCTFMVQFHDSSLLLILLNPYFLFFLHIPPTPCTLLHWGTHLSITRNLVVVPL